MKTLQDVDDSGETGSDLSVLDAVIAAADVPLSPLYRFVLLAVAARETLELDRAAKDGDRPFPALALDVSRCTGLPIGEADAALTELRRGGYLLVRGWVNVPALMPFLTGGATS